MDIVKAIIPVAGRGTRFAPYTTTIAKEMLPLLTRPALHYSLEEAALSSMEAVYLVTASSKPEITTYSDQFFRQDEYRKVNVGYLLQREALGLGHAVYQARHLIGKEYCAVLLPDDIIVSQPPALAQLMRVARQERASVIAVQEMPPHLISSYGVIGIKKQITPNLFQVSNLIEKPSPHDAPSNLAIVGRYILSSKIFAALEHLDNYSDSEMQLTDAIAQMLHNNERVFAFKVQGARYDIGTPLGWLTANVGFALQDPTLAPQMTLALEELKKDAMIASVYHRPADHATV